MLKKLFHSVMTLLMIFVLYSSVLAGSEQQTGEIKGMLIYKESAKPVTDLTLVIWGCDKYDYQNKSYTMTAISIKGQFPYRTACDDKGRFKFTDLPEGGYLIQQQLNGISMGKPLFVDGDQGPTPCIKVQKGKTVDIGKVLVIKE